MQARRLWKRAQDKARKWSAEHAAVQLEVNEFVQRMEEANSAEAKQEVVVDDLQAGVNELVELFQELMEEQVRAEEAWLVGVDTAEATVTGAQVGGGLTLANTTVEAMEDSELVAAAAAGSAGSMEVVDAGQAHGGEDAGLAA